MNQNIQNAVAQVKATHKPTVTNTNNYGQMYGVDAMAGYKWFFGKKKILALGLMDTIAVTTLI